jgi:hypothetical protein
MEESHGEPERFREMLPGLSRGEKAQILNG